MRPQKTGRPEAEKARSQVGLPGPLRYFGHRRRRTVKDDSTCLKSMILRHSFRSKPAVKCAVDWRFQTEWLGARNSCFEIRGHRVCRILINALIAKACGDGGAPYPAATVAAAALDPACGSCVSRSRSVTPVAPISICRGDAEYHNFLAQVEGVLPTSFFSPEDGKPFDPSSIDLPEQIAPIDKLTSVAGDIRLLAIRARLLILDRDIAGFALTVAAIAEWLDGFWDVVHPRPDGRKFHGAPDGDFGARSADRDFPLQYTALFEGRRAGPITYRSWIVANGEIKSRETRCAMSRPLPSPKPSRVPIRPRLPRRASMSPCSTHRSSESAGLSKPTESAILQNLPAQLRKMHAFIDPHAVIDMAAAPVSATGDDPLRPQHPAAGELATASLTSHRGRQAGAGCNRRILWPCGAIEPCAAAGSPGPPADRKIVS